MLQELRRRYPQVDAITISIPFLIIECQDSVPDEAEQVFLAAGLVCVFIVLGERLPFGAEYMGHYGEAEPPSDIPEDILRDSRPFNIPDITTFQYFHKLIPSCTHISSYPTQLVVELEKLSPEEFQKQLKHLPGHIGSISIGYINGLLLHPPLSSARNPDSIHVDGTCDDSDYLSQLNGGSLRPGVLLECRGIPLEDGTEDGIMLSNSGVKVRCGDQVRFTCAKHGWDKVQDKAVYHGGRRVGTVTESLGRDIGLVTTNYPFSNQLLDVDVLAKHLVHSSLLPFGEFVVIDSAYTSKQRMRLFGLRVGKKRPPPQYVGPRGENEYVNVDQGIFSVRADVINREPKIGDGVCGTPILRQGISVADLSALGRGEVVGFMHYTDIVGYDDDSRLYSYGQVVDPLIDDGWEVCED